MAKPDQIFIRDLQLRCIIGIEEWERKHKQDLCINLVMDTDMRNAGNSDDINDTVNYKTICKAVIKLVEASDYFLLEKMASDIADLILDNQAVHGVQVSIDKPAALRFSRSVAISIYRENSPR